MVRTSSRLAAATGAAPIEPVVEPARPTKTRETKKSKAAAKAAADAAEAAEKAAAEKAAVDRAAAEAAAAQKIASLRERQREASARYYAKKKAVILEKRTAEYANTTGQARRAHPPVQRQTFPAQVRANQQRYEQPQHNQHNQHDNYDHQHDHRDDEMPYEPQYNNAPAPAGAHAPDNRPPIIGRGIKLPPVPQDTPLTEAFIKQWLLDRDPPINGKQPDSQYNGAVSGLRITFNFTNLRPFILDPTPTLFAISNAKTKGNKAHDSQLYAVSTRLKMVQLILVFIEHMPIAVPAETLEAYRIAYKDKKIESVDERAAARRDMANSVMPYGKYKAEISRIYDADSKESLIANLYGEFPARDNFKELTLVKHDTELAPSQNYIVESKTKNGPYTIVLKKYKTSAKYGKIEGELTPELSDQIRAYIRKNNLLIGGHLLGDKKLSGLIGKMNRALGIPYSGINYIRHSIITTAFEDTTMTIPKRRMLMERMGHSIEMQLDYKRIMESEMEMEKEDEDAPVKPAAKKVKAADKKVAAKAASTKPPAKKRKRV